MNKQLIYPNPDFTPLTTHTPDGMLIAYDGVSSLWASQDGQFFKRDRLGNFRRRKVSQLQRQKRYGWPTSNGSRSGDSYPHIDNFRVHKVMARAWIGAIPEGWQVDHINGYIYNWHLHNIRIVTAAENCRCAVILRARRLIARQDNDPSKDPKNMSSEELMALFNAYNVAGDCYEGE